MNELSSPLSWFFLFAFSINGLIIITILLFKNKTFRFANGLLALNLLGISFISIMITMVESRFSNHIFFGSNFYSWRRSVYYHAYYFSDSNAHYQLLSALQA